MLTFNDLVKIEIEHQNDSPEIIQLSNCFRDTPNRIKIVRHSLNDPACRECYNRRGEGWWDIYQQTQRDNCFDNTDYIFCFVSNGGTSARYIGCWKVCGKIEKEEPKTIQVPAGFKYFNFLDNNHYFYKLEEFKFFKEYIQRLVINWGLGTRTYVQYNHKNDKEIIAIDRPREFIFDGYEKLILSYNDIEIINNDNKGLYKDWVDHLSAVNAVYLIVDTKTKAQYVGSAYGEDGLWGRWSHYVKSKGHLDDNKGIKKYLEEMDEKGFFIHSVKDFQFSILHITSKNIGKDEALKLESLYKEKLCSRSEHGLNEN